MAIACFSLGGGNTALRMRCEVAFAGHRQLFSIESQLGALLTADEQAEVARIEDPDARRQRSVGRGMLRVVAGHFVARPPEQLRISRAAAGDQPSGAPKVQGSSGPIGVSVAYGEGVIACAVCDDRVGLDLVRVRSGHAWRLAPELPALPSEPDHPFACYWRWSRHNAILKACGRHGHAGSVDHDRWSGTDIEVPPDHALSVVTPADRDVSTSIGWIDADTLREWHDLASGS
jgi:phosphopantetheinyl transferase